MPVEYQDVLIIGAGLQLHLFGGIAGSIDGVAFEAPKSMFASGV